MRTFVFLLALLFWVGCTTNNRFIKQYEVKAFTLHVADWHTVKTQYKKTVEANTDTNRTFVLSRWGFCDPYNRIMWVTGYDYRIRYPSSLLLPSLDSFGRCIWRLPELGGPNFNEY